MTFLDKIKALLGLEESTSDAADRDVGVTVEHDPSTDDREDAGSDVEPGSPQADTETNGGPVDTGSVDESAGDDRIPSEAVDVIKGIGPTYADRLSNEGIETVADLAEADPEAVAEGADVPRGRLEGWIERAKNRNR